MIYPLDEPEAKYRPLNENLAIDTGY